MRTLLTGADSLLGKSLTQSAPPSVNLLLTDLPTKTPKFFAKRRPLDVTDQKAVETIVHAFRPQLIIHLASLSDVDYCQARKKEAFLVNLNGTKNVIDIAKKNGVKVIFTSTNGVFDGKHPPYSERARPHPLHVYGKTKYLAEQYLRAVRPPHLLLRLMTMYGWPPQGARENPVTWALKKLRQGQPLNLVNDVFANPLYAPSAADAIWKLIEPGKEGIYHIAGKTRVSRYRWTKEIASIFGLNSSLIHPVKSSFFEDLFPRPRDTTFVTNKLQIAINWKPLSLKEGLTRMRKEEKQ